MHTPFMDKSPHRRDSAGGRLKQRLAQILTRSSCTTNTTSVATAAGGANSGAAFVSLARASDDYSSRQPEAPPSPYFCTPCTYERPKVDGAAVHPRRRRRRTRSASLVHISVDCTGGAAAASGRRSVHSDAPLLQHLSVPARDVRRPGKGRGKPSAARSPSASRRHLSSSSSSWGRARRPSRGTAAPYSWSSFSSTATDDEVAPFSSSSDGEGRGGEEAETRTLFSSLSFSSDSSEFYRNATRKSHGNTTARRAPRRALPRTGEPAPAADAFQPLVSVETRKHRGYDERRKEEKRGNDVRKPMGAAAEESGAAMAVVKRSSNPYLDFRSSMVEMVVERRIGSVGQMEELLGSYLSLNSLRHHPAILAAFEDVWEAVFGEE
ncbi:hypothetical protein SETIT_5G233400v2 [Setaria italica]|uniref:Transcription repressor n=1 Tax=Setaria italica TaxID=4555 RepID=A0A368R9N0_SETIT|nr:uncharacterized protein LOC101754894 [Setaria italica]RCV26290.1 hypothetical protein SETIT_5G233400v2 [Setaria italica]